MQAGNPRAAGREPESERARLGGCSCARAQGSQGSTRRPESSAGEKRGREGARARVPASRGGRLTRRGEARTSELPRATRRPSFRGPSPVAAGKGAGATRPPPPGAMNRAFSQCVVQAWPPRPVRGDSGPGPARSPAALGVLRPRVPRPGRHSARPRFGCSGLARRLGLAAAAQVTATPRLGAGPAPPPPPPLGPGGCRHSPASLWCPKGSRDASAWSLGLGPGESPVPPRSGCVPQPPGLPRLELRATRRPPPPPPLPARPSSSRRRRRLHHATSALSPSLRGSPPSSASPAPATAGEKLLGEGRNAPPSASGAGEPRNRRRHRPASPRRGWGPESSRPPADAGGPGGAPSAAEAPASVGSFYLRARGPCPGHPSHPRPGAPDSPPGFTASLALGPPRRTPSRHFGPRERG